MFALTICLEHQLFYTLTLDRGFTWEVASTLLDEKRNDMTASSSIGFYESRREWQGRRHYLLAFHGSSGMYTCRRGSSHGLRVTIDVGTNNEKLLNDEFYIGLRQIRTGVQEYVELLNEFMSAVKHKYGESPYSG